MDVSNPRCKILAFLLVLVLVFSVPVFAFAGDPVADLLNEAEPGDPVSPQSDALDEYLDELMEEIFYEASEDGGELDSYGEVKACYDYLVANVSYGSHMRYLDTRVDGGVTCRGIYNVYGEVEGFGAVALTANVGMCNAYASAFILMTRKLGYDAYLVRGSTKSGGGGYAYHEWAEINIDGTAYLFDPQLEQDLVRAGLPRYTVFCRTYDEVPGRYIKN